MDVDNLNRDVLNYFVDATCMDEWQAKLKQYESKQDKKIICLLIAFYAIENDKPDVLEFAVSNILNIDNIPVLESVELGYPKYMRPITQLSCSLLYHILLKQSKSVLRLKVLDCAHSLKLSIKLKNNSEVLMLMNNLPVFWDDLAEIHQSLILKHYELISDNLSDKQHSDVGEWFYDFINSDCFSAYHDYCDDCDELSGFDAISQQLPQSQLELTMLELWAVAKQKKVLGEGISQIDQFNSTVNYFEKHGKDELYYSQIYQCMSDPSAFCDFSNKLSGFMSVESNSELAHFFSEKTKQKELSWRVLADCYHALERVDCFTKVMTEEEFVAVLLHANNENQYLNVA